MIAPTYIFANMFFGKAFFTLHRESEKLISEEVPTHGWLTPGFRSRLNLLLFRHLFMLRRLLNTPSAQSLVERASHHHISYQ
jgi:hypothetical protein